MLRLVQDARQRLFRVDLAAGREDGRVYSQVVLVDGTHPLKQQSTR